MAGSMAARGGASWLPWQGSEVPQEKRALILRMLGDGIRAAHVAHVCATSEAQVLQLQAEAGAGAGAGAARRARPASAPAGARAAAARGAAAAAAAAAAAPAPAPEPALEPAPVVRWAASWAAPDEADPGVDVWDREEAALQSVARIQAQIFRRRVRSKDWFRGFDPLSTGRCTRDQFRAAVRNMIYPLSLEEPDAPIDPDALAEYFIPTGAERHAPQIVDYVSFCFAVDEVFHVSRLEPQPGCAPPPPGATVMDSAGFEPRPSTDPEKLRRVMARLAQLIRVRGIDLDTCLAGAQRPRIDVAAGRIRPQAFLRHFPLVTAAASTQPAAIDPGELDVVFERYTDDDGFLRFFLFKTEIEDLLGEDAALGPPTSFSTGRPLQPRRMRAFESSRGFPLQPPLEQQRGHAERAAQALQPDLRLAGLQQASRPQSARAGLLQTPPNMRPPLQMRPQSAGAGHSLGQPMSRPHSARATLHRHGCPAAGRSTGQQAQEVVGPLPRTVVTTKIVCVDGVPLPKTVETPRGDVVANLRLRRRELGLAGLAAAFRDADHLRAGRVTVQRAKAAMAVLKFDLPGADWEDLMDRYCDGEGLFHYPAFCEDVEGRPPVTPGGEDSPAAAPLAVGGNGAAAARALVAAAADAGAGPAVSPTAPAVAAPPAAVAAWGPQSASGPATPPAGGAADASRAAAEDPASEEAAPASPPGAVARGAPSALQGAPARCGAARPRGPRPAPRGANAYYDRYGRVLPLATRPRSAVHAARCQPVRPPPRMFQRPLTLVG